MAPEPVHRVLIVDDHQLVASALEDMLEDESGFEVVATAGSVRGACAMAAESAPDLVLVDQRLPDGIGTDLASRLTAEFPDASIVLLTADANVAVVRSALAVGCDGVISKQADVPELLAAIRAAAGGALYLSRHLASQLVADAGRDDRLGAGERLALQLLAEGFAPKDAAAMAHLDLRALRAHITDAITGSDILDLGAMILPLVPEPDVRPVRTP